MLSRRLIARKAAKVATRAIAVQWGERFPFYFVCEYPKSCGTWMAQMLGDYLQVPFPRHAVLPNTRSAVMRRRAAGRLRGRRPTPAGPRPEPARPARPRLCRARPRRQEPGGRAPRRPEADPRPSRPPRRPDRAGALELYDLAADPGDRDDLASRRLDARTRLVTALDRMVEAIIARSLASERVPLSELDEETLDSLRALGYLRGSGPSR